MSLEKLEQIRKMLEVREGLVEGDHPINYPFYLTMKTKELVMWFKVTGVNKGGGYTGFQVDQWLDKKTPSKAVTKTIPRQAKDDYKHVPAHEMPEPVMKRFAGTPDGGKKIGGDPEAKLAVKGTTKEANDHDFDESSPIERIRNQIAAILDSALPIGATSSRKDGIDYTPSKEESVSSLDHLLAELQGILEPGDSKMEKAVLKGMKRLKGDHLDVSVVVKQVGGDAKEVYTALNRLVRLGKVRQDGKLYSLN